MKYSGREGENYLARPAALPLTLIYGADQPRIRELLNRFVALSLGEDAAEELRLWRFSFADLKREPARLIDQMREGSFFGGKRGIIIHDIGDQGAGLLAQALEEWCEGDAQLFAHAGSLRKGGALRKALEGEKRAAIIAIYDDPIDARILGDMAKKHGLEMGAAQMRELVEHVRHIDHGSAERLVELLSIYQGEEEEVSAEELRALLPDQPSALAGEIADLMLRGLARELVVNLRRAPAHGISLEEINARVLWQVLRYISLLGAKNPAGAISDERRRVFGARRLAFDDILSRWTLTRLEQALKVLNDLTRQLRSASGNLPKRACAERAFLRIALMAR